MNRKFEHPYVAMIDRYYDACNQADSEQMKSTFCEDVVHYFVDHEPVRGADNLATYLCKIGPRTQATWWVEHAIVEGFDVAIEWSMRWTPSQTGKPEILRGSEWYLFRKDKIAEIRSYHNNYYLHDPHNRELRGYPYGAKGFQSI